MNPEEQDYFCIDEKNRVVLCIIEEVEMGLMNRATILGDSIDNCVRRDSTVSSFLEVFVKDLAIVQHVMNKLDYLKELDNEGYDIAGHMEAYLKCNDKNDNVKHLGKLAINQWDVGSAYLNYIYDKELIKTYNGILDKFNKM